MLSLAEFKKILGPTADGMDDKEIERLLNLEDQLADFAFDMFLRRKKSKHKTE